MRERARVAAAAVVSAALPAAARAETTSRQGRASLREWAPEVLTGHAVLGLEAWQWLGLGFAALLAFVLACAAGGLVVAGLRRAARVTESLLDDELVTRLSAPLRILAAFVFFRALALPLELTEEAAEVVALASTVGASLSVAWAAVRLVGLAARMAAERLAGSGHAGLAAAMPLVGRLGKALVLVFAAAVVLQNAGFNATGLFAGLGIGGIAVALAARKTIEDIFGGVTLVTVQPIRVGDTCRFAGRTGTVEEVGLRMTRVRTQERSLITIPNGVFAASQIENLTQRDSMLLHFTVSLRHGTTADQVRAVLQGLRHLLLSHPMIDPEPARARFASLGSSSLDVQVFAYVKTTELEDYLAVQEDVLLRALGVVEAAGTSLALPSQTLVLGRDAGLPGSA